MPEWLLDTWPNLVIVAGVAGGVLWRLSHLEREIGKRVTYEVLDLRLKPMDEKLVEIKALLTVNRFRPREDTDPGVHR